MVALSGAAPVDIVVAVSITDTNDPRIASVPASVTVPAGKATADFPVTMLIANAPSSTGRRADITATLGNVARTATLIVPAN
jgi:hypothetical protein